MLESRLIKALAKFVTICEGRWSRPSSAAAADADAGVGQSAGSEVVDAVLSDCLCSGMQVLLGLTNVNETGCRVLGAAEGAIASMARMAVADASTVPYPADHRQSFRALGLTLLINLTEHNAANRAVAREGFAARGPGGGDLLVDTFKVASSSWRLLCHDVCSVHAMQAPVELRWRTG